MFANVCQMFANGNNRLFGSNKANKKDVCQMFATKPMYLQRCLPNIPFRVFGKHGKHPTFGCHYQEKMFANLLEFLKAWQTFIFSNL